MLERGELLGEPQLKNGPAPAGRGAQAVKEIRTQWRSFLTEYGDDVLRVSVERELSNVSDEQRATGWLGYEGAGELRIAAPEDRLGTRLPAGYRAFLGASDGWLRLGPFMNEMRTTGALDRLDDDDADMYMDL